MANRRFIDFPIAASVGDNDIVLIWQDGLNKQTTKSTLFAGSPSTLASLTDVDISALTNGQILQYNSTTSKWENVDRTDIDLDQLGDVTIVSPTNGQVLVYNSSSSKWENSSGGFVPYTGAVTTVNLGAQSILAGTFVKAGGTSAQFLKADGSVDSNTYLTTGSAAATYVPYTGATADVNLGTHDLTAERGTFANNGSSDTLTVNHTSGSGIGVKVTKGGNNEALLVTKTSGSGNAMAVVGGRTALVDLSLSSVSNATGNFLTISGGVVHQRTPSETRSDVGAQAQLNGTGFVKASGTTITYDNSTYQVTSEKGQPNGYASLDSNGKVPLTQINDALIGNVNYQGLWNAATNNPTLANPPSSGTKGYYYIVSTAGTFASISFEVGDWIISNGSAWQKVDNTDAVSSVFGRTGNVTASNGDYNTSQVTENTNLYFTQARVSANTDVAANTAARHNAVTLGTANGLSLSTQQLSLQLATSGQNGALSSTDWTTFNNKENAITAGTTAQYFRGDKTFQTLNTAAVPELTNLYYTEARVSANTDVAANTAARHAAVTLGTANGLSLSTQQLSLGLASAGVTGALSGTDWTTFNSKQNALTNPVTGTGNTNYLAKFTSNGSTIGNSLIFDNGSVVGIAGTDTESYRLGIFTGNLGINIKASYSSTTPLTILRTTFAGTQVCETQIRAYNPTNGVDADLGFLVMNTSSVLNELITIKGSTQNVGIGTASPTADSILHVRRASSGVTARTDLGGTIITEGASRAGLYILTEGTNVDNFGSIWWGNGHTNTDAYITVNNNTRAMQFGTADSLRLTISGTGTAIFTNTVTATQFIRSGGTSSQFLKADGSVDSNAYYLASNPSAFIALTALSGTAPIQYNNTTGAISITQASGSTNGFLSSTDWTTFNNKQAALNGTGFVKIIGTTISYDNSTYLTTAAAASTYVPYTGATSGVDIGTYTLSASNLIANGGFNAGALLLKQSSNAQTIFLGYTAITPVGNNTLNFGFSTGSGVWKNFTLSSFLLTDNINRTYTLPDASGTIALVGGSGVGTVTSVAALTLGTSGTDLSSSVANSTTTPVITLNVPTASAANRGALSAADWTTFNNKQNALTNPVTGTGTTNYLPKFTGASTIGNSGIFDNAGNILIGAESNAEGAKLKIAGGYVFLKETGGADVYFRSAFNTNQAAIQVASSNDLAFATSNVSRMVLTLSGNLTIGNNSVSAISERLNVTGNGILIESTDAGSSMLFGHFGGTDGIIGTFTNQNLQIRTNNSTRATLDTAGNLGLGVTPSAWGSQAKAMQLGTGAAISGIGSDTHVSNGIFYDGSTWKYLYSGLGVSTYYQVAGNHIWFSAPSGAAAGNNVSLTQAMTLGSNSGLSIGTVSAAPSQGLLVQGNVGIGTSPSFKLDVNGKIYSSTEVQANNAVINTTGGYATFGSNSSAVGVRVGRDAFFDDIIINTGGNVSIGTTSDPGFKLNVAGTGRFSGGDGTRVLEVTTGGETFTRVSGNRGNANDLHVANLEFYNSNSTRLVGEIRGITGTGGTQSNSGQLAFYTNDAGTYTERMRITSGGNVLIGTTTDAGFKLDVNGTGRFSGALLVSNNDITQTGTRPILSLQQSGTTKAFWGISDGVDDLVNGASSGDAVFRKPASSGAFRWTVDGGSTSALVIASTGAATFSSSVQTGGDILVRGSYNPYSATNRGNITLNGTSSNILGFANNTTTRGYILHDGTDIEIANQSSGVIHFFTSSGEAMRINSGLSILTYSSLSVGGSLDAFDLKTLAPTGNSNPTWRLGAAATGTVNANRLIRVEIAGVGYDLVARQII